MKEKTLFLAWQDKNRTRQWFPVGRLDVFNAPAAPRYVFQYIQGAITAKDKTGFEPLYDFPNLMGKYESNELFPLFQSRVLSSDRKDFREYVKLLDLDEKASPIEILQVAGGYRATDAFEVFPKITRQVDGAFLCRFFLHGTRHVSKAAQERLLQLEPKEKLYLSVELTNPTTDMAVQIQTTDYHMIGWTPRYLVGDVVCAAAQYPIKYEVSVVKVNPVPAPSKQRLLVELRCSWPDHEPMTTKEFSLLKK